MRWEKLHASKAHGGMSFKELKSFNLALLAKQGWKLLRDSTSLLSRMYKAHYFLKSEFLNAKVGLNPSYAWHGIWEANKILLRSCSWCVGNGKSINI